MANLKELENKSIYIIREAFKAFKKPAVLWSIGKDSTSLLWLCKKALPLGAKLNVIHIDTGCKFKEIYEFREKYAKEWNLNLMVAKNPEPDKQNITHLTDKFQCCNLRKTQALKNLVKEKGFDGLFVGIRRDEHGIRAKESYFSPRDAQFKWKIVREKSEEEKLQGDSPFEALADTELAGWDIFATEFGEDTDHVRIHPILHWTEKDIWEYTKANNLPAVSLYFAKNHKRFRSIGCEPCCSPVDSDADTIDKIIKELETTKVREREGRAQDKEQEYMMQKLRSLGYM